MLQEQRWDLVCLQETHHANADQALAWCREGAGPGLSWRGEAFWNAGTSASRGVAILVRAGAPITAVRQVDHDSAGRLLRVDFEVGSKPLSLVCVYAPAEVGPAQTSFFIHDVMPFVPVDREVLLVGDFNCIASPQDRVGTSSSSQRLAVHRDGLDLVERRYALVDVWRSLHPTGLDFTHTSTSGSCSTRLDRWLVSSSLLPVMPAADILHGFPGDHCAVSLTLTCSVAPRGPGRWSFPLPLLHDSTFSSGLQDHIRLFLATHPLHLPHLTRRSRWDALKASVREYVQGYTLQVAHFPRALRRQYERLAQAAKIAYLADPTASIALETWLSAHHALQDFQERDSVRAALHAGVVWQDYGEQASHFFHHLAGERAQATTISSLTVPGTSTVASLETPDGCAQISQVLVDAFSSASPTGLFAPRATDAAAQSTLLSSLDSRFTEAETSACDAPLTVADLLAALEETALGKCPGSDGLPYEFYRHFWGVLGEELAQVFLEAFERDSDDFGLSPSQSEGRIVLLFKGGGEGARQQVDSYRPITLLNCDVKLLSKALAMRWGPSLSRVLDVTQTGFLPGRFIGDNILAHLEMVDYLEATQRPGCLAFLDFAKAYDRLDRGWLRQCMAALGFGPGARRWVDLLLHATTARIMYSGWRTPLFPVSSGVPQGSPLAPLLYVIAAQPLASRLRSLASLGRLQPILLPDGSPAPICHQHADDTSLHLHSVADLSVALSEGVGVFTAASGGSLQFAKCKALLLGGCIVPAGTPPIPIMDSGDMVRHLGIQLGADTRRCREATFDAILGRIRCRILHWSSQQLTLLGRVYVAKQVLASMLYHHGTYLQPTPQQLLAFERLLARFVGSGTLLSATSRSASLRPRRQIYTADWALGGVRMADVSTQLRALQGKLCARLLQPARYVWQTLMLGALTGYGSSPHSVWDLGAALLLSSFPLPQSVPSRIAAYVAAFRSLHPHRLVPVDTLTYHQVLAEPLFYNSAILGPAGEVFGGQAWRDMAAAGITHLRHLQPMLQGAPSPLISLPQLQALRAALPPAWLQHLLTPSISVTRWGLHAATGYVWRLDVLAPLECYRVSSSGRLLLTPSDSGLLPSSPDTMLPCLVLAWSPSWARRSSIPDESDSLGGDALAGLYFVGTWDTVHVDPSVWGLGSRSLLCYQVHHAAERARTLQLRALFPSYIAGDAIRPRSWESPPVEGPWEPLRPLSRLEAAWGAAVTQPSRSHVRSRDDFETGVTPAVWMRDPRPRLHWQERVLISQDASPSLAAPSPPTASAGLFPGLSDILQQPDDHQRPPWQGVYSRLHDASLDRVHRAFAWSLLHAALLPRAGLVAYGSLPPSEGYCTHPACHQQPETLTHALLHCPLAAAVTAWLCDLWHCLTGERPPRTAAVFIADDWREWRPVNGDLWTRLRLLTLHALWVAGRSRGAAGIPTNAASVVAKVIFGARRLMQHDWSRVQQPATAHSTLPALWFRGHREGPTLQAFIERWCRGGILARVSQGIGGGRLLLVRWSCSHPLPLPR